MPWLAAWIAWTPLEMPSSSELMSLERADRLCAVKKLVGLSSAEFTFLPVESRFWVVESRFAVSWSESRFWRVADVRVMLPDIGRILLIETSPCWRRPRQGVIHLSTS